MVSRHRAGSAAGKKNDSFWKSGDDKWMDLGKDFASIHSHPRIHLLTSRSFVGARLWSLLISGGWGDVNADEDEKKKR